LSAPKNVVKFISFNLRFEWSRAATHSVFFLVSVVMIGSNKKVKSHVTLVVSKDEMVVYKKNETRSAMSVRSV
jgi:hypothetical protein